MKSAVLLLSAMLVSAGVAIACDPVPDVDGDTLSLGETSGKHTPKSDSSADAPLTSPTSGGTPATTDSAPLTVDAGAATPTVDAFTGAPAFAVITPTDDTSNHHLGDSNAGKDCLSCHSGNLGPPTFALGGTVRATAGGTDGATGVQVRIVGPDGTEVASVGTDAEGNFWLLGAKTIPAGSHVGVRDGTTEKKMSGTISSGSCNTAGCHDPTRPIFLGSGT